MSPEQAAGIERSIEVVRIGGQVPEDEPAEDTPAGPPQKG
jgi:hypothetical protein